MSHPEKPTETEKPKLAKNLPEGFEKGASIGLHPDAVREINPNFYAGPPPMEAPQMRTLDTVRSTTYYTPLFHGRIDEITLSMEGSGILIDADGNAQILSASGKSHEISPDNMRGKGATEIKEPLTTYRTIAVDPSVIPLGTWVYVDFGNEHQHTGWYRAEDTGGSIKGNQIDIFTGVGIQNYQRGKQEIPATAQRIVWFEDGQIHTESSARRDEVVAKSLDERGALASATLTDTLGMTPQESGALHGKYLELIDSSEIKPHLEADRSKLGESPIADIRFNTRLLNPAQGEETDEVQKKNLKAETARRIAAYTNNHDGEWYTLDYSSVGGEEHLYGIGLGDILLDPDIEEILVDRGGELIHARRGVPQSGRHKDRQSFVDQSGNYVATYDGDRFKVLSGNETDLAAYMQKLDLENEQRKLSKIRYQQEEIFYSSAESAPYSEEDTADYLSEREQIERKLNPAEISKIPQTERVQEIPEKPKGAKRLVVFGDTNGAYGTEGQKYLAQLQQRLPEWNADFVIGVGDYIAAGGGNVSDERYKELNAKVKEEFQRFKTPFALALGNHDINLDGKTDDLKAVFEATLKKEFEYEESDGAYSYKLGNATFVVFNEGNGTITDAQIAFFSKKSAESKGAVYLINHVPPFQHAHGPGLPKDGSETVKNFDKIQALARANVEEKGRPFYIMGGHDHFHTVIGNFLNPGGMGSAYFGPDGGLKSNPSAAVVDMDADGKILAVYFRDAKSDFKDPLPEIQEALAWGNKTKLDEKRPKIKAGFHEGLVVELKEGQSVIDQITFNLDSEQMSNARIIEEEFTAAGLPPSIIAAAIINAHSESGLRSIQSNAYDRNGRREESYGVFQVNIPARRGRVTGEEMLDPRKNCQEILREVTGKRGGRLRALAEQGASVSELTAVFCYDIERPGRRATSQFQRARKSLAFFSDGVKQRDEVGTPETAVASAEKKPETGQRITFEFQTPEGLKGKTDLEGGQDTWILGSSSAKGMDNYREGNTGICGIEGANPRTFLSNFNDTVWPRIKDLQMPRQVVLMGLSVNGLPQNPSDRAIKREMDGHLKIAKFFEDRGVDVKITTLQPYEPKLASIQQFNETLREDYPQYCMDIAPIFTTEDGQHWKTGMAARGNLHLSGTAKRAVGRYIADQSGERPA